MVARGVGQLTAHDLAELKLRLHEDRRFRRDQLLDLFGQRNTSELQESCTAARVEVQAHLAAGALKVLNEVEAALVRMHTGEYGRCERCAARIDLPRLRVVPHARYCAHCHRAEELGL
jgi:DnaK suppressor protein